MKNQVNKKVSKLLIALLSLVIMSVACVSLAACNKECTHSKFKLSEDTATCVAGGFITHTCEDCGYAYMEPTPAKGHDYGTAEVVPATCTTDGYTVKTCKTCGFEEKSDATKATGHLHTSEVTVAATCIANGSKKVVCQDCAQRDRKQLKDFHYLLSSLSFLGRARAHCMAAIRAASTRKPPTGRVSIPIP